MEVKTAHGYHWNQSGLGSHHSYLLPTVMDVIAREGKKRVFDFGCGNGSTTAFLVEKGMDAMGVDASSEGIAIAKENYPDLRFELASAYDDLAGDFGQYPVVLSLEVVEHVYAPRDYAKTLYSLLEPGGVAIISTPYHGYLKNLALAVAGKWDDHLTALWDHGHIKFWSRKTLTLLLEETGFKAIEFYRVGRILSFAKSMILVVRK